MWQLLIVWAAVFFASGWALRSAWDSGGFGDPYRRLAAADRRRIELQRRQHRDEQAFLLAEIAGDESGW